MKKSLPYIFIAYIISGIIITLKLRTIKCLPSDVFFGDQTLQTLLAVSVCGQQPNFIYSVLVSPLFFIFNSQFRNTVMGSFNEQNPNLAYDACVAKNKLLSDGSECVNCVPPMSGQPNFRGVIQNGECVPKPLPNEV